MALKGDLKSINLGNVLQDVAGNELTGTLTVHSGAQSRHFWFEKGKLRLVGVGNGRGPSALNGLLALGKIKATDLNPKGGNVTLVRGLVKRGSVSREDVRAALEQQMTELVCDAFAWSEATFEFVDGEPDEDVFETSQLDHESRLPTDPIIMEAMRRIDEWSEIRKSVFSQEEILVALRDRAIPDGDETVERVASFFNGERRLRDIIAQTHLGEFAVFRAAATLLRAGAVRALTTKEALERGRAAMAKKQHEQALRMAKFGLEREPNNAELRVLAGEALEALERLDEAASEYRQLAASQVEAGLRLEAVATYRRILAIAPRDTFAHERLFALLIELGKKAEALQQGEALAAAYKRAGLPDQAKEVYTRLIQSLGDDDDLLESAAEVARRLGDKRDAVALYRKLFERALARGDSDAILACARTILRIDPSAEDVARRRMEVETGVFHKRQERRRRVRLILGAAVIGLIVSAAVTYEVVARLRLGRVSIEGHEADTREVLRLYNEFLSSYRWTFASMEARTVRNALEEKFVAQRLPKSDVPESELLKALAATQDIRLLVSQPDLKARVEGVKASLSRRVGEFSNEYIEMGLKLGADGSANALGRIESLTDPLALQAVQQLADHTNPAVRRAAVGALAKQPEPVRGRSDAILQTLVRRLASEPDAAVKGAVLEALRRKTGQEFGDEPNRWKDWLNKQMAVQAPGQVPSLSAVLNGRSRVDVGQPIHVEWRLENFGAAPLSFSVLHAVQVEDTARRDAALQWASSGDARRVELRSGEFVGGRFDLRTCLPGLDKAGTYIVTWKARVNWGGAGERPVEALPFKLEIVAPK